ncbi:MAG: RNA-binding protein [Cyanobacteria bacterium P01_H01_bin.121]
MSIRLYVGNLPKDLEKEELDAVFVGAGDFVSTKVITDRKTGKCRGFGFVTVQTDEQADQIIDQYNGHLLKESSIKIEKALPRAKGEDTANGVAGSGTSTVTRKGGKKSRRSGGSASDAAAGSNQPDPRWAQELEKLKAMLATQTANS